MGKKRTFISFDYDHDLDLKNLLVGQARNTDSPFEITDMSIKETIARDWKANARRRIKGCDVVVVICGKNTDSATGVSAELKIAQEEGVPYFLLYGRANDNCVKPVAAKNSDKMYRWTWDNLKLLIGGAR
ncbi:TIR domain-containing protein [Allofournierella massiliensis]|uniref:TIR domain-containing protein n=1 Tax=Allofournierella massiliensis TaxID=1650663 RepID=UPI0024B1A385|nr:TIR domain-containing protein [Fournierella massiliensis]